MAIGFPLFAALILIRFTSPEAKVLVTFFGISAAVEGALLDPMQRSRRMKGAVEQEMFDCAVLELEWLSGLAGPQPSIETTSRAASEFFKKGSLIQSWYHSKVAPLPIHLGRIVCQRGQYARILRAPSIIVLLFVVQFDLTSKDTASGPRFHDLRSPLAFSDLGAQRAPASRFGLGVVRPSARRRCGMLP